MIGTADIQSRLAIFRWLDEQLSDSLTIPYTTLKLGVTVLGKHVHLIGPQGIFKPAQFELPLSITTSPSTSYADGFDAARALIRYSYRGTDPSHPDNVGLRQAMQQRVPLIYFHGIEPGTYVPTYPVFIVDDNRSALQFGVQADDLWAVERAVAPAGAFATAAQDDAPARREYITATVRRRLHQVAFRERVVRAYRDRCALCALRHRELLDAAHITPDSHEEGLPTVTNGLSLCKLHHAAFDRFFFAVRPDFRVEVKERILAEEDGPMLVVGLQRIHGQRILLPSHVGQRPDRVRLERRYEEFLRAS